jgi:hypothetical protein
METTTLIMTKKIARTFTKLAGGVAVLYVTASEVEMKEKKTELMMHYTQLAQL